MAPPNHQGYIKHNAPELYARGVNYTVLEISRPLAEMQRSFVVEEAGHCAGGLFNVVQGNAWDPVTWEHAAHLLPAWQYMGSLDRGPPPQQHCFVLLMEVLDNLPHDRVERAGAGQPWHQTVVYRQDIDAPKGLPSASQEGLSAHIDRTSTCCSTSSEHSWVEQLVPVNDELVQRCIKVALDPRDVHALAEQAGFSLAQRLLHMATGSEHQAGALKDQSLIAYA
jgi:hypothetical protein